MIDLLRADASRQPVQRHFVGVLAQILGGLHRGQGVQIHDAVDAVVLILQRNIVLDRAQVIAQVLAPGGAGAGKYPAFRFITGVIRPPTDFATSPATSPGSAWRPVCSLE